MYTAGLAPFYASNFSLWSAAYCSASGPAAGGCFPLDAAAAKKPSFCIADILHASGEAAGGPADSLPGGPGTGMPAAALGAVHHGGPFHAAASPLRPTPVVAPDAPAAAFPPRLSPLSAAYHSHHHRPPQHRSPAAAAAAASGGGGGPAPARLPGGHTHGSVPAPASKDLKFGIDRILSAEFDPKVKEGNTLRGREISSSAFHASARGALLFILSLFLANTAALKAFRSSREKSYFLKINSSF